MQELPEIYIENDKWQAPFLLAASFQKLLEFRGSNYDGGVLYWHFFPRNKAEKLLDQFQTKTEPHIFAKDLLEAIDTFWRQVAGMKNGEMKNGKMP